MIKTILSVFVVILIAGFAYIAMYQPGRLPVQLQPSASIIRSFAGNFPAQAQKTVSNIRDSRIAPLGESIQTSQIFAVDESNQKPIHQKALELARYEYCKQAIKEYEGKSTESPEPEK